MADTKTCEQCQLMVSRGIILTLQPKLLRWPGLSGKAFDSNLPLCAKPVPEQAGNVSSKLFIMTGFPLQFIPNLMRGGNDKIGQINTFYETANTAWHTICIFILEKGGTGTCGTR